MFGIFFKRMTLRFDTCERRVKVCVLEFEQQWRCVVRALPVFLLVLFFVTASALPQRARTPVPVGVREGEKAMQQPLEPPFLSPRLNHTTPVELKQQALDLSQLAAGVPSEIEVVNRGELPKELPANLKKIEKLAKKIRSEISR
jgi:hypothetical protein